MRWMAQQTRRQGLRPCPRKHHIRHPAMCHRPFPRHSASPASASSSRRSFPENQKSPPRANISAFSLRKIATSIQIHGNEKVTCCVHHMPVTALFCGACHALGAAALVGGEEVKETRSLGRRRRRRRLEWLVVFVWHVHKLEVVFYLLFVRLDNVLGEEGGEVEGRWQKMCEVESS